MIQYAMDIGKSVKAARIRKKLSQEELGIACGYSDSPQGRISHYETGKREPSLTDLSLIADATGTTVTELLTGSDNSPAAILAKKFQGVSPEDVDKIVEAMDLMIQAFQKNK